MASESKLGACAQVFRVIFIIFNFIFLLLGVAILSVGIYLQVTSRSYSFVTGSDVVSLAIVFIFCGVVTGLIAAVGFVGACMKWRPLLVIFAVVLGIIILLEVVTGIVGFYFRTTVEGSSSNGYRTRLNDAIRDYRKNPDDLSYNDNINSAVDYLQNILDCCGTDEPSDWGELNGDYLFENSNNGTGQLPSSCDCVLTQTGCGRVNFTYTYNTNVTRTYNGMAWTRGCYDATLEYTLYSTIVIGAVSLAIGIFEVVGILIALGLCCCVTMGKKEEYV